MKKTLTLIVLSLSFSILTGCSTPIKDVRYEKVSFNKNTRTTLISAIDNDDQKKIKALAAAITEMADYVDENEAKWVAREAVLYPQHLANQYKLISPPIEHNKLVNAGKRDKGLCYHWARDMESHLGDKKFKTLEMRRAVSYKGMFFEHSTVTVAAKKSRGITNAIVLDPWRNSGKLYWGKVFEDPRYIWRRWYPNEINPK